MGSSFQRQIPLLKFVIPPLALCMLYFIITAAYPLDSPGLYYDEVLFVNAATEQTGDHFIYQRAFGLPIMVMPYIGALKAYIFLPVFKLFGVSPASIRIPVILMSSITLIVLFYTVTRISTGWLAMLTIMLLATDPSFIFQSKLDYGPVVVMMFFKTSALFLAVKIVQATAEKKSGIIYLWLLVIAIFAGMFDKLNFIWFVLPMLLFFPVIFWLQMKALYFAAGRKVLLPAIVLILGMAAFYLYLIRPVSQGGIALNIDHIVTRLGYIYHVLRTTMDGSTMFNFIHREHLVLSHGLWVIAIWLVVTGVSTVAWAIHMVKHSDTTAGSLIHPDLSIKGRYHLFFVLILFAVLCQIVVTREATASHHIMMLYPFHMIIFVLSFHILVLLTGDDSEDKKKYVSKIAIYGFLCLIVLIKVGINMHTNFQYIEAFSDPEKQRARWSERINAVSTFCEKHVPENAYIISADWGLHNPLFALAGSENRSRYRDLWGQFKDLDHVPEQQRTWIFNEHFNGRHSLVILYSQSEEIMKGTRNHFFTFCKTHNLNPTLVKTVGTDQRQIYEIYRAGG